MKKLFTLFTLLALTACATPVTTMKNSSTGQVATCGGSMAGSAAGGMIGYNIQKNNDAKCVENFKSQGFKVLSTTK